MNDFNKKFVQHLPNSLYGLPKNAGFTEKIGYANNLLLFADKHLSTHVNEHDIKAIIVPNSELTYSGLVAASVYNSILGTGSRINKIKTIIILGTRHSGKPGILIPNISYFIYNKSKFKINRDLFSEFINFSEVKIDNNPEFLKESSIEIQMPFIWKLFVNNPDIEYLPIIVGPLSQSQCFKIGEILNILNNNSTLWIITSDMMSVNGKYQTKIDSNLTRELIKKESQLAYHLCEPTTSTSLAISNIHRLKKQPIDGIHTLILWTAIAKNMKLIGKIGAYYTKLHVEYTNLIDTTNIYTLNNINMKNMFHRFDDEITTKESISYLSLVYIPQNTHDNYPLSQRLTSYEKHALHDYVKRILVHLIVSNPKNKLEKAKSTPPLFVSGSYSQKLGTFISLKNKTQLRGCIGCTHVKHNILINVIHYTVEAGFNDNRKNLTKTNPLKLEEIEDLTININLINSPKQLSQDDIPNSEIIDNWKLGYDGIMLINIKNDKNSLFLPSVPIDMQWNKIETLSHLSKKAGLHPDIWKEPYIKLFIIPGYEFGTHNLN